jgi:spermidine synthase
MNVLKRLKYFFLPQVLETFHSKYNGDISVVSDRGRIRLVIGGLTQSGQLVDKIWTKGITYLRKDKQFRPESCLILGLGGGTAAKLISDTWPGIKIFGVEIDPAIIRLGKKYLGLGEIKNQKIIIADAVTFVRKSRKKFNLIIVDTYRGDQIPSEMLTEKFIKVLVEHLTQKGVIIFNLLFYTPQTRQIAQDLVKKLNVYNIVLLRELTNLLVVVHPNPFPSHPDNL